MFMEKCDEWLRGEAVKKFKFLTAREELIALEFAAWLNRQAAQQSVQWTLLTPAPAESLP